MEMSPEMRPSLKKAGFVTRDPRAVERISATQEGPAYKVTHGNYKSTSTRARAYVRTNGELGRLDNASNLTLMKAMDMHPSDPPASAPADFWDAYAGEEAPESAGAPVDIEGEEE